MRLLAGMESANLSVVELFCMLHDPQRRNERRDLKWSDKFGQRAKVYPTRTNGYENDKTTELFRQLQSCSGA